MPKLSQEQIDQAREVDLLAYLLSHESGVLKQEGANYRHNESKQKAFCFFGRTLKGETFTVLGIRKTVFEK